MFWSWVDDHVREDGRIRLTSVTVMSQLLGGDESFWHALMDRDVRWLGQDEEGLFVPEWDNWFGASRRARLANAERQREYRKRHKNDANASNGDRNATRDVTEDATD